MKIIVFGASGGTGQEVVKQALDKGYEVTAFVRSSHKINIQHERLHIVSGDATDRQAVCSAIEGHDAVLSCLGTKGLKKSNALEKMAGELSNGMLEHGVKRIIYVATAGIHNEIPGIIGKITGLILRNVIADHRRATELLTANGFSWTIARPLQLVNGPLTEKYRTALQGVPAGGSRIARADVAHFLLQALEDTAYLDTSVALAY